MTKLNVHENELAQRWGMSPKTLQRWRSEGRGPRYFKLSRKVIYPMAEIQKFEAQSLYASTSERANDIAAWRDSAPEAAKEDSAATQSPMNQRSGESNNGRVRGQVLCKT
ncbi:helix-turn-helix domain-containing protein [Rhodoferax sp.]|uniref:helix-turn-helix transcriptional regulator n=1 Tax=Rhodoferax sp. TaxID=50421 RepID=UPI0026038897|nr:helix-turn-helix domain-containing protein [Rhodoferax sp.]MDD5479637.1 helix-turn-helix domain-containing protein [Rhodoferax sp.]